VQDVIEALVDVWTEVLVAGGRIELQNFLVLETKTIDRGKQGGMLTSGEAPRYIQCLTIRASKRLKRQLQKSIKHVSNL